jgi:predicted PolB exonuclease-like 3'-5' exonuclease
MAGETVFIDIETVPIDGAVEKATPSDLASANEVIKELSLSALTARILCCGIAINHAEPIILDGEENSILQRFWTAIAKANCIVGHNVLDFDLLFILQRSIINGVRPSRDIPFARFKDWPVFDTMQEWCKWSFRGKVSLAALCEALGIPVKQTGLDGSKVYDYYMAGRLEEIYEYCKSDVVAAREVYKRLTWRTGPGGTAI